MIDRLPPQSLEAEQSVLGAILIDRDAVVEVAEFLRPADFYRQANGKIFEAVLELFERREPIDIVTVSEALERSGELEGVGGRAVSEARLITPYFAHFALDRLSYVPPFRWGSVTRAPLDWERIGQDYDYLVQAGADSAVAAYLGAHARVRVRAGDVTLYEVARPR